MIRASLAAAFVLCAGFAASAQPQTERVTSSFVLSGCRALVENDPNGDMMQMGACAGAVSAALEIGRSQRHVCPPDGANLVHAARVVTAFFDEQPSRQADAFGPVAWRALGDRWGCRR